MRPRILFVSICPKVSSLVSNISRELDIPIQCFEGGMTRGGLQYAQENQEDYDVIISHGGTASHIRSFIKRVPILNVNISVSDFLDGFKSATKFNNPIALFCAKSESLSEMQKVSEFYGTMSYKLLSYSSKDEFEEQSKYASTLEGYTLIGLSSYCMMDMQPAFKDKKIKFSLINPSRNSIINTIMNAKEIISDKSRKYFIGNDIKIKTNQLNYGVLSVDNKGVITSCNKYAENLLKLSSDSVLSHNLDDLSVPDSIRNIFKKGNFELNNIHNINGNEILVNKLPISIDDVREETIVSLYPIPDHVYYRGINKNASNGLVAKYHFDDIVGNSKNIVSVIEKAKKFSDTSASILIDGETGTGKEVFVQSIHNASSRAHGPFVAVNCAALPESLLESELFGYADGAFTGGRRGGRAGLFELAHNGTIFLDEIGEISPAIQSRLLRVLQEREVLRIGGDRVNKVNVRVISATNKNLYKLIQQGLFREDLFFRINVLNLHIPSLRERIDDIPVLVDHFIKTKCYEYDRIVEKPDDHEMSLLKNYSWPGNIRELENFVEKYVILSDIMDSGAGLVEILLEDKHINMKNFSYIEEYDNNTNDQNTMILNVGSLKYMQNQIIEKLLQKNNGNKVEVAKKLGISRVTVWNKMKEMGAA